MKHFTASKPSAGFALTEVLVSILLLAIAMLGAGAALVDSIAGQRAALLQTRAADLAANLAEALRAAPDDAAATTEIGAWRMQASGLLPQAEAEALASSDSPAWIDIHLQWHGGRGNKVAELTLPIRVALNGAAS